MKDLQRFYIQLASSLERLWTSRQDKRHAAILLRNAAIETPHCHFCGCDSSGGAELYESRYNPKARICKLCAADIHGHFTQKAPSSKEPIIAPEAEVTSGMMPVSGAHRG